MRKGEIKRAGILDAAERLFLEKGYEGTSVQDILDALGMSKGGFYHYFDAKDSVLQAVTERRVLERVERLCAELRDPRRKPADRLDQLLGQASLLGAEEGRFAALMLKLCYVDRDPSMVARRRRVLVDRLLPAVEETLAAGMADGSFFLRRPAQTARLLLLLAFDVDEEFCAMLMENPDNPDALIPAIELLNACRDSVETLVGAHHGALGLLDVGELVRRCREAMAEISTEGNER